MPMTMTMTTATERLRASPSFTLTFAMDGRAFLAKETEIPVLADGARPHFALSVFQSRWQTHQSGIS